MLLDFLLKRPLLKKFIYRLGQPRADFFVSHIQSHITKKEKLLDIGTGIGNIAAGLLEKGYTLTPLDIRNLSFNPEIVPVLYDGNKIPFKPQEFDVALVITVLHHITSPERVLAEAKRVARRIIIIEDIYTNPLHKYLTYFFDSLLNLEFKDHPHSNKTDMQWKKLFSDMQLSIVTIGYARSFVVFKHVIYVLEPSLTNKD